MLYSTSRQEMFIAFPAKRRKEKGVFRSVVKVHRPWLPPVACGTSIALLPGTATRHYNGHLTPPISFTSFAKRSSCKFAPCPPLVAKHENAAGNSSHYLGTYISIADLKFRSQGRVALESKKRPVPRPRARQRVGALRCVQTRVIFVGYSTRGREG